MKLFWFFLSLGSDREGSYPPHGIFMGKYYNKQIFAEAKGRPAGAKEIGISDE